MRSFFRTGLGALALAGASCFPAFAQQAPLPACGTDEMMRQVLGADYDRWMASYTAELAAITTTQHRSTQALSRVIVPVVVHIIHTDGSDNITDAEVYDAIRLLNQNYQYGGPDSVGVQQQIFKSRVRTSNFEFRLAGLDPQGNRSSGITRHYSALTDAAGENVKNDIVRWDPLRYLNVWVVETIASGAGGYSFLPCPNSSNEGVVIRSEQFSSIGRSAGGGLFSARSLTHEVGHYFGLPHTWGGSNTPGVAGNCALDDGIADTPNEMGVSGQGCPLTMPACTGASDPYANVENYMNYASCPRMFTAGQVDVMRDRLTRSCRATLVSPGNLTTTGTGTGQTLPILPPEAYLWAPNGQGALVQRICAGSGISFHGEAYGRGVVPTGGTVTYQWTLPGGQPASATGQDVTVNYATPGTYAVTLTVTDANGTDTYTRDGYVAVASSAVGLPTGVVFGFDNNLFPVNQAEPLLNWEIGQTGTGATWEFTSNGYQSNSAARIRVRNAAPGTVHDLISPTVLINSALTGQKLYFRRAYSPRNSTDDDLQVHISTDCGRSFGGRSIRRNVAQLTSATNASSGWIPQANEWKNDSLQLPNVAAGTTLRVRFRMSAGSFTTGSSTGNALYLDDLRVGSTPLGLGADLLLPSESLSIYPNPSDGAAHVRVQLAGAATLSISDATGRRVSAPLQLTSATGGPQEIELNAVAGGKLAAGLYLVELRAADGARRVQRALVY